MTVPWHQNDELFRSELKTGHRYANIVANYLVGRGVDAKATAMRFRDRIEDAALFADEFDIVAGAYRIDVKSRRFRFTTPQDHPYPTTFVDTVAGWDAKKHKPHAVVIISQPTLAMLVVPPSTQASWVKEERFDRVRGIQEVSYGVPMSCLRSIDSLVEWLRQ